MCNLYERSQWHIDAAEDRSNFIRPCNKSEKSICCQINTNNRITIERNRQKLFSKLKGIYFAAYMTSILGIKRPIPEVSFAFTRLEMKQATKFFYNAKKLPQKILVAHLPKLQTSLRIELNADILSEKMFYKLTHQLLHFLNCG